MAIWGRAEQYILLALAIEQHLPGYVDAYYGPRSLKEAAARNGRQPLEALAATAGDLETSVLADDSLPQSRTAYLLGEIRAMRMTLELLQGERVDIADEAKSLYGISVDWTDESAFIEAHKALDQLLPGNGTLYDRSLAFSSANEVPPDRLAPALQSLVRAFHDQTRKRFSLPEDETLELAFVHDKPWTAYNWYLGNASSRIDFNLDVPLRAFDLPYLVAHEAYPGHHTEHSIKERILVDQLSYLEHSILPSLVPSALISEGIAEIGIEVLLSPGDVAEHLREALVAAGLPSDDVGLMVDAQIARDGLRDVRNNALLLLHRDGASDEQVLFYLKSFALLSDERAALVLRFSKDPLWRSYGFTYVYGPRLVGEYIKRSADRIGAFEQLLVQPLTPSLMRRDGLR
jgi:hypothetical protein